MEYEVQHNSDSTTYVLAGQLTFKDHDQIASLKTELMDLVGGGQCILDLQALDFVDSSGLGSLIAIREAVEPKNIEIVLSKPQPKVLKIIEVCGFDSLFRIET